MNQIQPKHSTSNYQMETSMPAYQSNQEEKLVAEKRILQALKSLGGKGCILQLHEMLQLPSSTISGRLSDLREKRKVKDSGTKMKYRGYTRIVWQVIEELKVVPGGIKTIGFFE